MASGLGSFVKGAVEGYSTVKEIQRREALQKRDDERFAMEQERYGMEKTRAEREMEQQRLADEAKKEALSVMEDQKFGRGAFAKFADPAKVQAMQQATQSVEQKSDMSYDRAEARRLGRTVDETQTASVTPQEENIFKQGGEGLYADQRAADNLKYQLVGEAMKKSLINKGDFGAAMLVDRDINKMIEEGYDLQRKKALAFVTAGAPPSTVIPALKKVYGFIDDGKDIDVGKSTYDPKTRAYSLSFVDQKTGQIENRVMNEMQLATVLKQADSMKVIETNISSDRRAEDLAIAAANRKEDVKLAERGLAVKEKEASATLAFRNAQMIALGDQVKGSDVKARIESVEKAFPLAGKIPKMDEMIGENADALKASIQKETFGRDYAYSLSAINPKVDPRIIIGASKAFTEGSSLVKKTEAETGRKFFQYGGTKLYLD